MRRFATTTRALLELADWFRGHQVSEVAMESTGVYWKPVWNLLEDEFSLLLVNAQHVKNVPGCKTDVQDCVWLAKLLQRGLLRGSFVRKRAIRELRELCRHRTSLVQERSAASNRIQPRRALGARDLGAGCYDRLQTRTLTQRLVTRLESLGHQVSLAPAAG